MTCFPKLLLSLASGTAGPWFSLLPDQQPLPSSSFCTRLRVGEPGLTPCSLLAQFPVPIPTWTHLLTTPPTHICLPDIATSPHTNSPNLKHVRPNSGLFSNLLFPQSSLSQLKATSFSQLLKCFPHGYSMIPLRL